MFPFWKQKSCGDYLHENALLNKKFVMIFVTDYKKVAIDKHVNVRFFIKIMKD